MKNLGILPKVQKVIFNEGIFKSNRTSILEEVVTKKNQQIHKQGYRMQISEQGIVIEYSTEQGLFYGKKTLKQLFKRQKGVLPCCTIEDYPDLPVRGVLFDISRNKVPKLETLYKLVDILADLKYNQLQLYGEGRFFEYESCKVFLEEESYITKDEISRLAEYCKERYIDLVPNHNTLGHMEDWLALDAFKALRENPEGTIAFGMAAPPSTLNPEDPKAYQFVEKLTLDLLGHFESDSFNPNLDEPFGLGEGTSQKAKEPKSKEALYIDWIFKMYNLSKKHHKKMMMWADIIIEHPERMKDIPKDIVLMDWGYEDHFPFNQHGELLQKSGLTYYVCPGTSSWHSIIGRTDNMLGNVDKAIESAHKYGALGMIMTDWGDSGHWQTLSISYPGFVYGGAKAWNKNKVLEEEVASYLNEMIFEDENHIMGQWVLDAGRLHTYEDFRLLNGTMQFHHFKMGLCTVEEKEKYIETKMGWMIPYAQTFLEDGGKELVSQISNQSAFDYIGFNQAIKKLRVTLNEAKMVCDDQALLMGEYDQALKLIECSIKLREYIDFGETWGEDVKREALKVLMYTLEEIINLYHLHWIARNKMSHLEKSKACFKQLYETIKKTYQSYKA